jgi:hypothetical protein
MHRDYLIERMNRLNASVYLHAESMPVVCGGDRNQQELVESVQYILLKAHAEIEEKIAEYSLKTAIDSE